MPAIRKIRIVNFRFNDNAKLIPDEIFCTENDGGKPIDTLLNLENGGGKSVLVQLMLQPVCPKAKVQNRNISDYFQKGTDHAFVLIEWALDNKSSDSLLTGIAIAASVNADDGTENKNIRFYTFMHDYPRSGDKLDLINLPLTEKKDGRIRALSFDELRKLLQNRKVAYFPSDQLRRYQSRLEEYGILSKEWENTLVRINAIEGGIEKFFEEYKTADRLLDRFIIPGVLQDESDAEHSIEEMFQHYARSYAGQEENLRLQSQLNAFTHDLEEMLPFLKSAWNASDARTQAIRRLFDLLFTLEEEIREGEIQKEQFAVTVQDLRIKLRHIQAEQLSEAYYLAKEQYDDAEMQLQERTQQRSDAKKARDHYAHELNVLNAAKEYADLTKRKAQESALLAQLQELDADNPDAHVRSLRYSLYCAANTLENRDNADYQQKNAELQAYAEQLAEIENTIKEQNEQLTEETERCNRLIGRRDTLHEQISEGLAQLALRIMVMLDGSYSSEDIKKIRSDYVKQKIQAEASLQSYAAEEQVLQQELANQDGKRSELLQRQAVLHVQMQELQNDQEQYREKYAAAAKVLEHLSLPLESLFSEEPLACIDRRITELHEQLNQTERSERMLNEKLANIQNGQLHLSKSAISFLKESGVPFQTGEHYLLHQSPEVRNHILASNSLAAYAVVVNTEKEQKQLLSQLTDTWLSSIVPVYTLAELAAMAEQAWKAGGNFLSAYDQSYFTDEAVYRERVEASLSKVQAEIQHLHHQIDEWKAEREVLKQFDYPADAEKQMAGQWDAYQKESAELKTALSALDTRQNQIRSRQSELKKLQNQQQEAIHQIAQHRDTFEKICDTIRQYEQICTEIVTCKANCKHFGDTIAEFQKKKTQTDGQISLCKERMEGLEAELRQYRSLLSELDGCEEAELLDADYPALLEEYRLFQRQRSSDRQELQKQLDDVRQGIQDAQKELQRFDIPLEEYEQVVYTDTAYRRTAEQSRKAEQGFENASDAYTAASSVYAGAETGLKQAKQKLDELHMELLERSEVGSDFLVRIAECTNALHIAEKALEDCEQHLRELTASRKEAARHAGRFQADAADYTSKRLSEIPDIESLRDEIEHSIDALKQAEESAKKYHQNALEPYRSVHSLFSGTLDGILNVIGNQQIHGDKYYTLCERTEADLHRYRERIGQLAVVLKDVENSRQELVTHCRHRVERLYDNLKLLSKKSAVQLTNTKRQMLRIDLPEIEANSELPSVRINTYITEQVKNYLSELETSVNKRRVHLEIRRLLNCYIGTERIPITVYKIDRNPQNSRYRSWEDALKANSGGEQFVIFFTLVVSMMNYTRSMTANLGQSNDSSGVLILDNPFGPISSPHLLEPMFRIAHHFHIQLICLTHLGTAAVTNCFDMVYQLRFRTLPLSSIEVLESEVKQHMEHAFYLSEQLALF